MVSKVMGLAAVLVSLISFLPVPDSVNDDEVFCEAEQNAEVTDSQPVVVGATLQFFHIPSEIILKLVEAKSDITTHLLRQLAKLLDGFRPEFNLITHDAA